MPGVRRPRGRPRCACERPAAGARHRGQHDGDSDPDIGVGTSARQGGRLHLDRFLDLGRAGGRRGVLGMGGRCQPKHQYEREDHEEQCPPHRGSPPCWITAPVWRMGGVSPSTTPVSLGSRARKSDRSSRGSVGPGGPAQVEAPGPVDHPSLGRSHAERDLIGVDKRLGAYPNR